MVSGAAREVASDEESFGRGPETDVVIPDRSTSRRLGRLEFSFVGAAGLREYAAKLR